MLHARRRRPISSIVATAAGILSLMVITSAALAIDKDQFVKDIQFAKGLAATGKLSEAITFQAINGVRHH